MKSDWELRHLGDIAEIVMGQSPPGDSYNADGIGLPLLNGPTDFGLRYPVPTQFTTAPAKVSRPGDVIFCVRGSTTGRMNTADQQYCLGRGVAAIRGATDEDTRFIHALLQSALPRLLAVVSGSTFPNLSRADLREFEISWPDLDHRRRIAGVLGAFDNKIEHNTTLRDRLLDVGRCLYRRADGQRVNLGTVATIERGLSYKGSGLARQGTPMFNLANFSTSGWANRSGMKFYIGEHRDRHIVSAGDLLVANTDLTQRREIRGQRCLLMR